MDQGLIQAWPMGDFVGAEEGDRCYSLHKLCPTCGSLISDYAEKCQDCHGQERGAEIEKAGDAMRLRIRRQRERRYNAALAAGWTVAELCPYRDADNHDIDPLPTMDEIGRRRVGELIKSYCEGMGQ